MYIEYKDAESANKARLFRWETEKNMIVRSATPRQARPSGGKRDRRRKGILFFLFFPALFLFSFSTSPMPSEILTYSM